MLPVRLFSVPPMPPRSRAPHPLFRVALRFAPGNPFPLRGALPSASLPLGLPAGKLAAAVGLAVQTIFPRKRDGPLIAALFLKIRG
jgi:hypothetical protein